MGLAASQVRMLSLTSRKASIERDILQGSNRKVALSREMNNLANEYYDALSAERLMYLSDTGEYTNLSYQYLMGKPGGVEDIDVKSDTSMILLDTESSEVVLSSTMAQMIGSVSDLRNNSENIYLAIARLCGDRNITTPDGYSDINFMISPALVKDICAGKYDTFDANDLADAIKNNDYWLWAYDMTTSGGGTTVTTEIDTSMFQDVSLATELSDFLSGVNDVIPSGEDFSQAYLNGDLVKTDVIPVTNSGSYYANLNADYAIENTARDIATKFFNKDSYNDLTVEEKTAVAKVMTFFEVQSVSQVPQADQLNPDLVQRFNYAYKYHNTQDNQYEVYFDSKLFVNALYTATHNGVGEFDQDDSQTVYSTYSIDPNATVWGDNYLLIGNYSDGNNSNGVEDLYTSFENLFQLTNTDNNTTLVQIGTTSTEDTRDVIIDFLNELKYHAGYSTSDTIVNHFLEGTMYGNNSGCIGDIATYFTNNAISTNSSQDLLKVYTGTVPTDAAVLDSNIFYQNGSPNLPDSSTNKLRAHVVKDANNRWFTYVDASALISYFYASALGANIGYGHNRNGEIEFLSPTSNPDSSGGSASTTTDGAYTPILTVENYTTLRHALKFYNLEDKYNAFAITNTVEVSNGPTEITITNNHMWTTNTQPNHQNFCPAGECETQWIQNFKDLIRDVKFYFPIVTACAKYGMNDNYDFNQNLKDGDYIDKNIQNGVFQLMGFETDVFSLNSAKDTDYYLLTSEFSKMNDPAQQAIITAWYETEKAEINSKETYWDTLIENLSAELNSINAEIESVKSLIDDAVKNTFDWGKG